MARVFGEDSGVSDAKEAGPSLWRLIILRANWACTLRAPGNALKRYNIEASFSDAVFDQDMRWQRKPKVKTFSDEADKFNEAIFRGFTSELQIRQQQVGVVISRPC